MGVAAVACMTHFTSSSPSKCNGKGSNTGAYMKCSGCQGTGEAINDKGRCSQCKDENVVPEKKVLEVHVDNGMQNGQQITFDGEADEAVNTSLIFKERKEISVQPK